MIANSVAPVFSDEYYQNPYPTLAYLRQNEPVHKVTFGGMSMWITTRYDDTLATLKDDRFTNVPEDLLYGTELPVPNVLKPAANSIMNFVMKQAMGPLMENMLSMDDPDHARLRNLVHRAFTPRLIQNMHGRIQGITNDLLDAAEAKGEMELIEDFALPLPMTVIAEILGVPHEDHDKFRKWSLMITDDASFDNPLRMTGTIKAFSRYMRGQFELRRSEPRDDLLTALVQAEESGDKLNEDELLGMVMLLLIAGHETTVNLIGNGTFALMQNRDQWNLLQDNPALIKPAIEEFVRYDSPVHFATERFAKHDLELGGATIKKGEMVVLGLGAANRDPAKFENPDTLDIMRTPNKHLAYGQGVHYCVGAPLARMEASIAFTSLIERFPDLRLAIDSSEVQYRPSFVLRGLQSLPVKW